MNVQSRPKACGYDASVLLVVGDERAMLEEALLSFSVYVPR